MRPCMKGTSVDKGVRGNVHDLPSIEECLEVYVPNYCEETVWHILHLAQRKGLPAQNLFAVFITNAQRCVGVAMQRAASEQDGRRLCFWDYHVIPIIRVPSENGAAALVFDCDSLLPFPTPLVEYVNRSLRCDVKGTNCENAPHHFRVVRFDELVNHFASDRRHMLQQEDLGNSKKPTWSSTPPQRPCIRARLETHTHTLPFFLHTNGLSHDDHLSRGADRSVHREIGTVFYDAQMLLGFFGSVATM